MAASLPSDLIWEITRTNHSMLVKRKAAGGVQFSRDPLNLTNKHSRKYEGFVNQKAIGVNKGKNGGVTLVTKKSDKANKPGSEYQTVDFASNKPARSIYRSIVNSTAKKGYRSDLRAEAVARASAIKRSQRAVKESKPAKLRGAKAKKAEESS